VREIENNYAEHFLNKLYSWCDAESTALCALAGANNFGSPNKLTRMTVDFNLAPRLNALFRLNMENEALKIINTGTCSVSLKDVKMRQNKIVNELMTTMVDRSTEKLAIKEINLALYQNIDYKITNFIGLVCSKVKDMTNKTALVYARDGNKIVRGSVRGLLDDVGYCDIFNACGFRAAGHKGAFGIQETDLNAVDISRVSNLVSNAETLGYADYIATQERNVYRSWNCLCCVDDKTMYDMAHYNARVRGCRHRVLDCPDSKYVNISGQYRTEYRVDGRNVIGFEPFMKPEDCHILPMLEGDYIKLYFKKKFK
jgi:hypothetical protein